jgi:hypothetical protein
MSEVTRILDQIQHGDRHAAEQLLPLVYDELRKLAAQKLAQEKSGRHPGLPSFNVLAGGPGSLALAFRDCRPGSDPR